MRVLILTGSRFGVASACLPLLAEHPHIQVAMVVLSDSKPSSRWAKIKRNLRKVRRIGPLGALVGFRMRSWYASACTPDLLPLAEACGIRVERTPAVNHDRTRALFREAQVDLGLSLGNGYIAPSVFEIPRQGMINVHGEILPRFQGAASVIWPIHEGIDETGFTIHQIDRGIDTGAILYQERFAIALRPSLKETVRTNCLEITRRVPPAIVRLVADYPAYAARAVKQTGGCRYTTPTIRQYLRMLRQHRLMRQRQPQNSSIKNP